MIGFGSTQEHDERGIDQLKGRMEYVAEMLENYNIDVDNYDGTKDYLFEMTTSNNKTKPKMVYPDLVRDNTAVLKVKIFIKQ